MFCCSNFTNELWNVYFILLFKMVLKYILRYYVSICYKINEILLCRNLVNRNY